MFGGIAIAGNLLAIASTDARGRIFLFDLEEGRIASSWSWSAEDGGPSDAGGIAFDRAYNIYVADARCDTVRQFTLFGRPVRTFGRREGRGAVAVARDQPGVLDRPHAVAVHEDTLFVAGGDRWLVRGVQRFTLDGAVLPPLHAAGDLGGRFGAPRWLCVSGDRLLVADTQHGRIAEYRVDGTWLTSRTTACGQGANSRPIAVVVLPCGAEVVADAGDEPGLVRLGKAGRVERLAVSEALIEPSGLSLDAKARVHVLDRHGERVVRLDGEFGFESVVVDLREVILMD